MVTDVARDRESNAPPTDVDVEGVAISGLIHEEVFYRSGDRVLLWLWLGFRRGGDGSGGGKSKDFVSFALKVLHTRL